jgi:hypothetical protein
MKGGDPYPKKAGHNSSLSRILAQVLKKCCHIFGRDR